MTSRTIARNCSSASVTQGDQTNVLKIRCLNMKKINLLFSASLLLIFGACSQSSSNSDTSASVAGADSAAVQTDTILTAKMYTFPSQKVGMPLELNFTVYNHTDSAKNFCKWHTPFEPLMSKYLDIVFENGEEAQYKGPMAKRMMPPPADSYVTINKGDSLSVKIDLLRAYSLNSPGQYKIIYNSENISSIRVTDTLTVNLEK